MSKLMSKLAIGEISGKQYKILPNQPFEIEGQPQKTIEVNILMMVEDGKMRVGKPYLKEKLTLKSLTDVKGEKIRVGKYHAKANYRRVKGSRAIKTMVIWDVKKRS